MDKESDRRIEAIKEKNSRQMTTTSLPEQLEASQMKIPVLPPQMGSSNKTQSQEGFHKGKEEYPYPLAKIHASKGDDVSTEDIGRPLH